MGSVNWGRSATWANLEGAVAETFVIKSGDNLPVVRATLVDEDFNPVNLTGVTAVVLRLVPALGPTLQLPMVVDADPTTGKVSYAWPQPNTAAPGTYEGEIEVTFADGKKETFPNDHHFLFSLYPSLK